MAFKKTHFIWGVMALFVALIIAWGIWQSALKDNIPEAYKNTGGGFSLQSPEGLFSLSDWRGKVVLIYFGYTHCPDKCPVTLANWAAIFAQLKEKELKKVGGLLITVDPQRDSLLHLKAYTSRFHANILGLTGEEQALRRVALQYRADFEIAQQDHRSHGEASMSQEGHEGFLVDHTSFVYVVGQDGRVREMLPFNVRPEKLLSSIRRLL